ncbi:hypothetical protein [Campylobacter phage CJLB-5]|nr:hypothetical protein [Campylobacter phage CJLB-5]DAD60992.1 MAG TPA: hypothetical protein [Caudoviricetes sp.]DAK15610.1 MAG TPA: hypothetical protein [Caudoviricetes sp.]DAV09608.1 MAG TPA: hypothetical protein [Caudoviricetes sp.]
MIKRYIYQFNALAKAILFLDKFLQGFLLNL